MGLLQPSDPPHVALPKPGPLGAKPRHLFRHRAPLPLNLPVRDKPES